MNLEFFKYLLYNIGRFRRGFMNKKKKLQLLSLSAALVMMCSLGGCSKNVNNTNNKESEERKI